MKLLIDSSTNYLYLAIYDQNKNFLTSMLRSSKNDHSETLVDTLKTFLDKNHYYVNDIEALFVGRGPGSYTGVRISGTVAKVLGLVKKIPLYSFSTLDLLLVSMIKENDQKVLAKIEAKKNHSYYKKAIIKNHHLVMETPDLFNHDDALDSNGYQIISPNEEIFLSNDLFKIILDEHLYQEEDVFSYVPNYLRPEING